MGVVSPDKDAEKRRALKRGDSSVHCEIVSFDLHGGCNLHEQVFEAGPKRLKHGNASDKHVDANSVHEPDSKRLKPVIEQDTRLESSVEDEFTLDCADLPISDNEIDLCGQDVFDLSEVPCIEDMTPDAPTHVDSDYGHGFCIGEIVSQPDIFRAVSSNVTSLSTQWDTVQTWPFEVIALQETKMTAQWQADFDSIWDTHGWQIVWGKAVQHMRTPYEGRNGGVAIMARAGIPFRRVEPASEVTKRLWESGRWVHACVGFGDGKSVVHVFSVYGFTNSRTWCPDIMAKNEALLSDVFEAAAELGNVRVVILGDLNVPVDMSSVIHSAISTGRWGDAAAAVAQARCREPDNTCFVRDTSKGSRIDAALCSTSLMHAIVDSYVVKDIGLPTHLPVCVEFSLPESRQLVDVAHRPMAIPLDFVCIDKEQEHVSATSVAQRILDSSKETWAHAIAASNVEALASQWSTDAEKYLIDRSTCIMTCNKKCYQGRGVVSIHRKQRRVAKQDPESGAMPLHTHRLLKLLRRLEDLIRQMHSMSTVESPTFGCVPQRWLHLWALSRMEGISLCSDPCVLKVFSQPSVPTIGGLREITAHLRHAVASSQYLDKQSRVNAWKSWLQEDWANTGSGVYKWCKGDSGSKVSLMQRPDGTLTGNAVEINTNCQNNNAQTLMHKCKRTSTIFLLLLQDRT